MKDERADKPSQPSPRKDAGEDKPSQSQQSRRKRSNKLEEQESSSTPKTPRSPARQAAEKAAPKKEKESPAKRSGQQKKKTPPVGRLGRIVWFVRILVHFAPIWLLICILLVLFGPAVIRSIRTSASVIAPLFTPEVRYWAGNIAQWSVEYEVNPNLVATLMQIESCGYPGAASSAGAQGLFQVMPFHFESSENMTDPETNARRGIGVIKDCLERADGDVGLAMACYNGGPRLISLPPSSWPAESQRYYTWGGGIYNDAIRGLSRSAALDNWLAAGGIGLCRQAATALNLATMRPISSPVNPPVVPTVPTATPLLPTLPVVDPTAEPPQTPIPQPGVLPTFDLSNSTS